MVWASAACYFHCIIDARPAVLCAGHSLLCHGQACKELGTVGPLLLSEQAAESRGGGATAQDVSQSSATPLCWAAGSLQLAGHALGGSRLDGRSSVLLLLKDCDQAADGGFSRALYFATAEERTVHGGAQQCSSIR